MTGREHVRGRVTGYAAECVSISFPSRLLAKCGAELSADFVLPSHVPFSQCLTSPQILSSKTVQSRTESTAPTPASEMAALTAHPPDGKTEPPTLLTGCLQAQRRLHPHPCRKCYQGTESRDANRSVFSYCPNYSSEQTESLHKSSNGKMQKNVTIRSSEFVTSILLQGVQSIPNSGITLLQEESHHT